MPKNNRIRKERRVKAYGVVDEDGFGFTLSDMSTIGKKDAEFQYLIFDTRSGAKKYGVGPYKVVPVTISYRLPKRNQPKK